MRMRAGVQHHTPRGPASPQPGNRPAALANLVACGTDLNRMIAVAWRMPVGLHRNCIRLTNRLSPRGSFGKDEKLDANAGRTTWEPWGSTPRCREAGTGKRPVVLVALFV